jgi:hypothetical protein
LRAVVLFSLLLASACAPIAGPVLVEAIVADPGDEQGVRLDDVELDSVTDLRAGEGALFSVRGGLRMAGLTVSESVSAGDSFEQMRERTRGDGGAPLNAAMSYDGTRYIADDFDTLVYFSLFAAFERAWRFAEEIGDDSGATKDTALVGLSAQIVAADILPLPLITSDNAAYAAPLDAWLTLRVGSQDGVPFAMSGAILAHEFSHRLFHRNVYASEAAFATWRARLGEPDAAEQRATRILQGVDEGLADLFSIAATEDIGGLPRALTLAGGRFADEGDRRDIEGDFADAATYENLRDLTLDARELRRCNASGAEDIYSQASFNFYCLGTVVARTLWEASERDLVVLRTETLPAVRRGLARVGDALAGGRLFDVDVLLDAVAAELPPGAPRDRLCAAAAVRFSSLLPQVASCR